MRMNNRAIPIADKYALTIPEACEYFGLGRDKLYELCRQDGCRFVIHNGRNLLIKRKAFEKISGEYLVHIMQQMDYDQSI